MSRKINTSHSKIFDYWKDKEITPDGNVILNDIATNECIPVVLDWDRPCCFACRDPLGIDYSNPGFCNDKEHPVSTMWNYPEVRSKLNKCHIIPHSAGGNDEPENLFLLCEDCHVESPDTGNPKNFFKWVYKRRKRGLTVNGFVIAEFIQEFLQDCKEKGKDPTTLKPEKADIYNHGGRCSQSTLVMALSDTCDDL